jgi:hypothetical protein
MTNAKLHIVDLMLGITNSRGVTVWVELTEAQRIQMINEFDVSWEETI